MPIICIDRTGSILIYNILYPIFNDSNFFNLFREPKWWELNSILGDNAVAGDKSHESYETPCQHLIHLAPFEHFAKHLRCPKMKVILIGSTGFVGREVLDQCLAHPAITSVVALSRRELPPHDKLKVVVTEDFLSYPESVRDAIKGADACIWYKSPSKGKITLTGTSL